MSAQEQGPVQPARDSARRRRAAWWSAAALLLILSWPGLEAAVRFPDTAEYLSWPEPVSTEGYVRMGPRMPAYPLMLRGLGTGPALVQVQVALALAGWGLLGWQLAGTVGALLAGIMLLAPEMRVWQFLALTESASFSLLAGLVALGLILGRRWRWAVAVGWAGGLLIFTFLRPANAAIVPFLLAPFVLQIYDLEQLRPWSTGLRPAWARLGFVIVFASSVTLSGLVLVERSEFWRMNYTIALLGRVVIDPEAREYFRAADMPTPVVWQSDEFAAWFEARARSTYESWVFGRAASYADAWWWLRPDWQQSQIMRRYAEPVGAERLGSWVATPASWLYAATAPPRWLWFVGILAPCVVGLWRGNLGVHAFSALVLAAGAYVQCFVTFHASAAEPVRHTLAASMLYRIAFVLALRGGWDVGRSWLRSR